MDDSIAIQLAKWIHQARGVAPFGMRHDSPTAKGLGYFGRIPAAGGAVSTEISASNDDGDFPLLVPTLSRDEIDLLTSGGQPTDEIYRKAEQHAAQRRAAGRSPFADPSELRLPLPVAR